MKAFVINVIGDVGLVLAAILLQRDTGALDFRRCSSGRPEAFTQNEWLIVAICLLILVGAFAKSAQLPLHTWLAGRDGRPDAGLRADPRRDDGHRRRLPDRAHASAVRARADRRRHLGRDRCR